MNSLPIKIKYLFQKGFFHIFGANVLNKLIAFATNIVIVWFLTKDSYGVFSYANNIYSFILLATGFGLLTGMFQLCTERRPDEEKVAIYQYALTRGLVIDCGLAFVVLAIGFYIPLPIEQAGYYLALFSPLLILDYLFQYASIVLRSKKENKKYASLQISNTVMYFIAGCLGAQAGGIEGTILGRYIAYIISLFLGLIFLRQSDFLIRKSIPISRFIKRDLWSYSIPTQISSSINQMTFLLDVFLIGIFVESATSVASYKVATMLPEGLLFIPSSLVIFALPYFVEHNKDARWFRKMSNFFLGAGMVLYALLAVFLLIAAPYIIETIWGSDYLDAVIAFRLLTLSFVFSALRLTCTNLLCALRAVKSNLVVSVLSLIVNAVLCLFLIPIFGINGAAAAPLTVSIVATGVAMYFLNKSIVSISKEEHGRVK